VCDVAIYCGFVATEKQTELFLDAIVISTEESYMYILCITRGEWGLARAARFSTKYGRFLSVDPSKSSPPNVSINSSVHVAIRTQIPHKQ